MNINVDDYVMIHTPAKPKHKLQSKRRGPMLVKRANSNLVYVVEDLIDAHHFTVHAQRVMPYPITKSAEQTSEELKHQVLHFDPGYHLVDGIVGICNCKVELELLIKWSGLEGDVDRMWEPLNTIQEDVPGVLEDFIHTSGDRNLKRGVLDLYI